MEAIKNNSIVSNVEVDIDTTRRSKSSLTTSQNLN
jgi:hypothetical protein